MSISDQPGGHPVVDFAARFRARLDWLAEAPVWSMTPTEQADVLVDLARARAQLDGLWLRVLAAADTHDVAAATAATSTAAWLAATTRQTRATAHAEVRLAQALSGGQHAATREALSAGRVDLDQARVVVRCVDALPATVDVAQRELAEKHLVGLATDHDAAALRVLGRHLLAVIDPEAADQTEGQRLAAEEAAAARATSLQLCDNGDGTHAGRFRIPTLHAAMLTTALNAFANPHRPGHRSPRPERRPRPEVLGAAFCELLERLPADRLPTSGGVSATVVVTLDHDRLLSGLGAAQLDTGHAISAAAARRVACEAGIAPAVYRRVLGAPSVVLDLGRTTRLHTEAQRLALAIRDGGCTAEGCDRPPGWCHAHHDTPWATGGTTSIDNGRLLCAHHHHRAHDPRYTTTHLPTGKVTFHRRT
jgi:hypothetical protein